MGIERRKHRRVSLNCEAMLAILVPDQTFTAKNHRSIATDLSTSGVRLKSYQLKRDDYHTLIKGVNYAKLNLNLPYMEEPLEVRGRIVWVEFHDTTKIDPANCIIGVKFDMLTERAQNYLDYVVDRLNSESVGAS